MSAESNGDMERGLRLEAIAARMRCRPGPTAAVQPTLRQAELIALGVGSISREMCGGLADFGLRRFVLVDPKRYRLRSVQSQCEPGEVGRLKVDVVAEWLRNCGAEVTPLAADLYSCPDGIVGENAIVVVSADNRRAEIGANRLAARMRRPLVKVNIEPKYNFIAVRCFDFRDAGAGDAAKACLECHLTDRMYANQRHPRSCDGPAQRRTAAPRWLSRAAGAVAALTVMQLLDDDRARALFGRQWAWVVPGESSWCELAPSPSCRWEHGRHWPNLKRLAEGPREITLAKLLRLAKTPADGATWIRFCRSVATRLACDRCARPVERIRWVAQVDELVERCACGGRLTPVAYWTQRQLTAAELAPVADRPLADWGVPPLAVIEVGRSGKRRSFVVGPEATPRALSASAGSGRLGRRKDSREGRLP